MIAGLDIRLLVAVLLALATLAGGLRLGLAVRAGGLPRGRAVLLALLQGLAALLLYWVLFPPAASRAAGTLTVLTQDGQAGGASGIATVALPEAGTAAGLRAPDLATALRRHPEVATLEIRGRGLTPRDLDAAQGHAVRFAPAPLPAGLVALHAPAKPAAGTRWTLRGRVERVPDGEVELRDPAGAVLARAGLDDAGGFVLDGVARAPGRVVFDLRVLDAAGEVLERVDVPLAVAPGAHPRVLLLAGAPGSELRALQRWAVDAGLELDPRVQLSRGVSLGAAPGFAVDELPGTDLLVLDERVWDGLETSEREALREALRGGLGVLLRVTGPLSEEGLAALADLGFLVADDAELDTEVRLPRAAGGEGGEDRPLLSRRPIRVEADDAAPLLRGETGEALALWRGEGRGRMAVWWLGDSYRLALDGEPAEHASLWSGAVGTLLRPGDAPGIDTGTDLGVGQRRVLCGLQPEARVRDPDGDTVELVVGEAGCAGFWPAAAGWHVLHDGRAQAEFHVRAPGAAPGLQAAAVGEATQRLAAQPRRQAATAGHAEVPVSPWPFFLAWLAIAGLLWWLEKRSRLRAPAQSL